MLELHGIAIPDKPYSIVLMESRTAGFNRRVFIIEGWDNKETAVFLYGDYEHCYEQFTQIREQISDAGMYVREVGRHSAHVYRHMLVNVTPQTITRQILKNLIRYPIIKQERLMMEYRIADHNRGSNGGMHNVKKTHP